MNKDILDYCRKKDDQLDALYSFAKKKGDLVICSSDLDSPGYGYIPKSFAEFVIEDCEKFYPLTEKYVYMFSLAGYKFVFDISFVRNYVLYFGNNKSCLYNAYNPIIDGKLRRLYVTSDQIEKFIDEDVLKGALILKDLYKKEPESFSDEKLFGCIIKGDKCNILTNYQPYKPIKDLLIVKLNCGLTPKLERLNDDYSSNMKISFDNYFKNR